MIRFSLSQYLRAPVVTGQLALITAVAAVGLPTGIRWAISSLVSGCEFTPYLPFVLLSAFLLRPWQAMAVALASAGMMGGLLGPPSQIFVSECFLSSAGLFLASSAAMIGVVVLIRRVFAALQNRGVDEALGGIVFSLEQGEVWASWYGQGPPVLLGTQRKVATMMADFLRQEELGRRLNGEPETRQ
jgi:hypothetical protein